MSAERELRVMLVDDEQPARERLRRLLEAHPGLQIVGEAEDGEQAAERIQDLRPDLLFLDIQMPGCTGLELAASLAAPRPRIIFCTAFDEYAVDAFELHAVDYLLKPVNRARLAKALERVRGPAASEEAIDRAGTAAGSHPSRFLARRGSRYRVVPWSEVLYFASDGGVTLVQTEQTHYWMQPTLTDLENRLDPRTSYRISRAAIVNLDAVVEVVPQDSGNGEVRLRDGTALEVSRRRFKTLMERLARG